MINEKIKLIFNKVSQIYAGDDAAIRMLMIALLTGGHVLIEDVPGIGKTTLIKAFASVLGLDFKRIQFTPDLLPSDITGITVYNPGKGKFEFNPGPLESNIILADEINRSSPKTQSSLLEAMQENQITVDGTTRPLPSPFVVMATQNPIEYEGTFPLPEAQLDRFSLKIKLGYPSKSKEMEIIKRFGKGEEVNLDDAILSKNDILDLINETKEVHVEENVADYIIELGVQSRNHKDLALGISSRGTLTLYKCAKAAALIKGREYVIPDDVKEIAVFVLAHRIILKPEARLHGKTNEIIINELIRSTKVINYEKSH